MDDITVKADEATPASEQDDNAVASAVAEDNCAPASETNEEPEAAAPSVEETADSTYYNRLAREDIETIHRLFPESMGIKDVTELDNPLRFAALRDMGLTAKEAYLATQSRKDVYDNRNHLRGSVPSAAGAASDAMSQSDLSLARDLFSGLNDREIQRLYRKVTK